MFRKIVLSSVMSIVFLFMGVIVGGSSDVSAVTTGYGGNAPACTIYATPDSINAGDDVLLTWSVNENVIGAYLHPKGSTEWMQEVPLIGSWWVAGVMDSSDYELTVVAADSQLATCDVHVAVTNGVSNNLECNLYADPANITTNQGVNIIWSSTGNVVDAYLHRTGSADRFASISPIGSMYFSGLTDDSSYSVTMTDSSNNSVTCDTMITVTP